MTKPAILAFTFSVLSFTMLTANAVEDQRFIDRAARDQMADIELAKLASERAQSQDVKGIAQTLVQDNQKANDELKQIAQKKGAKVPTEASRGAKREHDRLAKLSGTEFDREYVRYMLKDHDKDLKDFQKEAKSGKDADLKKFASDNVAIMEQHRKQMQDAQVKIGSASKGAGGGQAGGQSRQAR